MGMQTIKESVPITTGVPTTPTLSPGTPPPVCRMQSQFDFSTTTEGLDFIDRSYPGMIRPHLALGYIHRSTEDQPSAVEIVSNDIIPWLAGHNYRHLVLEIFPRGEWNSRMEHEIRLFNRTGEIGPEMNRFIFVFDQVNFIGLLHAIHAAGIQIHSGGVNYSTAGTTILSPDYGTNPAIRARVAREIVVNSVRAIRDLRARGLNSASLNGIMHNDINPPPEHDPAFSFGHTLSRLFPYAEIELVMPELAEVRDNSTDLPLPHACDWSQFIPASGIRLLSTERTSPRYGTFLIYYSRTPAPPTP